MSAGDNRNPADGQPAWVKPAVDFGPLLVFVVAYFSQGIMAATLALIVATAVALVVSLVVAREVPVMALVTAAVVGVFGGLTLWLDDEAFIKMKPSIVYLLMAAVLGAGLLLKRPFLAVALGKALDLDATGWRLLSFRLMVFFAAMAVANEVVRRAVSTDLWVLWKMPGLLIITFVFMIAQAPLIQRHRPEPAEDDAAADSRH